MINFQELIKPFGFCWSRLIKLLNNFQRVIKKKKKEKDCLMQNLLLLVLKKRVGLKNKLVRIPQWKIKQQESIDANTYQSHHNLPLLLEESKLFKWLVLR